MMYIFLSHESHVIGTWFILLAFGEFIDLQTKAEFSRGIFVLADSALSWDFQGVILDTHQREIRMEFT